ncbi:carbohydrate binding domain-containing protein [Frigoribacterium sp. VKM Ac-2836]|uniref:carbohydrate binding domain-containing protein n=1 Tax=Frigoribacterium sp. VKM Ac-2836 TaxID=2739014 RepID=UPI001563F238|nr:carbohydrate binding domain-containing protein [Frigoribacterium sp. VKM Ac-2836]NRD25848.1 carbohydrate binding domain-containing protein [Frigoribacterium sp. VKM Ac-2836]
MTVRVPVYNAFLVPDVSVGRSYVLNVVSGSLYADEGNAPLIGGTITVSKPSPEVMALIDPYAPRSRVTLQVRGTENDPASEFSLKITAIQEDAGDGLLGINLASDESLLMDYALPTSAPIKTFWGYQNSGYSIVVGVLNRVLGPGRYNLSYRTANKQFPTYSALTNLIPNGSFDNGLVTPWVGLQANVSASTGFRLTGQYSLLVNPNSTSNDSAAELAEVRVTPGKTYTVSGFIARAGVQPGTLNARARRIWVYTYIDGQVVVVGQSPQAPNTAATSRQSVTFTVPANAESVNIRLYSGAANGTNAGVYWENVLMVEGDGLDTNGVSVVPFFDGATTDSTSYVYEWTGDTNNSASTRTPVLDRGPDALTWMPGQTAWDFLTPILDALGWRLSPGKSATLWNLDQNDSLLSGSPVRIGYGTNLYEVTDLKSRTASNAGGVPQFADAVVVHYQWTDTATLEKREAYDSAGPSMPQKTHLVEYQDTAYPGPGAAAYILERLTARRRQLQVSAAANYTVWPGQEIVISPGPGDQVSGYIDAVDWDLSNGVMSIRSKNLIINPTGSLGASPDGQTVGSVSTTVADYTS